MLLIGKRRNKVNEHHDVTLILLNCNSSTEMLIKYGTVEICHQTKSNTCRGRRALYDKRFQHACDTCLCLKCQYCHIRHRILAASKLPNQNLSPYFVESFAIDVRRDRQLATVRHLRPFALVVTTIDNCYIPSKNETYSASPCKGMCT